MPIAPYRFCEAALRLDAAAVVRVLRRHGELWARWSATVEAVRFPPVPVAVTCGGAAVGEVSVGVVLDGRRARVRIATYPPAAGVETLAEMIGCPCPVSGIRWWWRCPEGRVGALYKPADADTFGSRQAHGLLYGVERGSKADKAARKAQRLRRELGELRPLLGAVPPPPPLRMTARRYLRTCAAIREAEAAAGLLP